MKSVDTNPGKIKLPVTGDEKDTSTNFNLNNELEQLKRLAPQYYISKLKETRKGTIDIEMVLPEIKTHTDTSKAGELYAMMSKLSGGVMLRGAVNNDGQIKSFYLNAEQKNMIAFFFELPGKPVKVGDKWPISTNLLHTDQSFKCDSAFKRSEVTVLAIENIGNDKIVTLKYDIQEYINGEYKVGDMFKSINGKATMMVAEKAIGKFSVNKGRWVSYEGELTYNNEAGLAPIKSKQILSLISL
ncbi:MAG TPA: hypothetical protein ENO28_18210 [Bacteroidetes bacterium]|nr:hypothetical protein [Bacteroidota bacterium]